MFSNNFKSISKKIPKTFILELVSFHSGIKYLKTVYLFNLRFKILKTVTEASFSSQLKTKMT